MESEKTKTENFLRKLINQRNNELRDIKELKCVQNIKKNCFIKVYRPLSCLHYAKWNEDMYYDIIWKSYGRVFMYGNLCYPGKEGKKYPRGYIIPTCGGSYTIAFMPNKKF